MDLVNFGAEGSACMQATPCLLFRLKARITSPCAIRVDGTESKRDPFHEAAKAQHLAVALVNQPWKHTM